MGRRALYMFGSILNPGPAGQVDTGLGPKLSSGTIGYMEPTETVSEKGGTLTIDGLAFDFLDAGGTEAPSEFVFYVPAYKALHTTEVVTHNLHNILTLRGAQVRDALRWSKVIDATLLKWGGQAEVALASHHWPTWGAGEVSALLANQRDAYRYVHDRTLFLANRGATLHELADATAEAPVQSRDFSTRGYYGTLNHDMKAVYQRYFGWWDGNPANFNPLPPEQSAPKYVALAGGADKLLAAGNAAIKAGEYRWAAELLNKLVFAEPDNQAARGGAGVGLRPARLSGRIGGVAQLLSRGRGEPARQCGGECVGQRAEPQLCQRDPDRGVFRRARDAIRRRQGVGD